MFHIFMNMKTCSKCKQILPESQFGIQKASKWVKSDRLKSRCRECESIGVLESRKKNKLLDPEKYIEKQKKTVKYNISLKYRNFAFILRYLQRFGKCIDCGIKDIRVLEFDHVKGDKISGVILMAERLASIGSIKNEIRKCEIRCCNCHRIKTQQQLGFRKHWKDNWLK